MSQRHHGDRGELHHKKNAEKDDDGVEEDEQELLRSMLSSPGVKGGYVGGILGICSTLLLVWVQNRRSANSQDNATELDDRVALNVERYHDHPLEIEMS